MSLEHVDVLIVGAGLSGIGAACHLQANCPGKSYAILEARDRIGGTWDLFRYPGIRSDSDMYTLGYSFRPWREDKSIADGSSILEYVRQTAREHSIEQKIRFDHRVVRAEWSTEDARWTVEATRGDTHETVHMSASFLLTCSGYYRYDEGYTPDFQGTERFAGRIVHPQHWSEDVDYAGKRVVVIGSGATAVTLVPALAQGAAQVTMLQRSPSYILSIPQRDAIGASLQKMLPRRLAYRLIRWKNILAATALYQFARRRPQAARALLVKLARRSAGPAVEERHLQPRYEPWDQRLCIAPDADIFRALRSGQARVVTDTIECFTPDGLRLASGAELPADIVVAATGLQLQLFGGACLTVDGRPVQVAQTLSYKGMMISGVPNLALSIGYTNASWTLRAELIARQVCRMLNHMRARNLDICLPVYEGDEGETRPAFDLHSGYVERAADALPRQGGKRPWHIHQNYLLDFLAYKLAPLADGALRFSRRGE
jgi:monooxygenase